MRPQTLAFLVLSGAIQFAALSGCALSYASHHTLLNTVSEYSAAPEATTFPAFQQDVTIIKRPVKRVVPAYDFPWPASVKELLFSPSGKELIIFRKHLVPTKELEVWNLPKRNREFSIETPLSEGGKPSEPSVEHIALSAKGGTLAVYHSDNKIRLWSMKTGREMATFDPDKGAPSPSTFSGVDDLRPVFTPDGTLLFLGQYHRQVQRFDPQTGKVTKVGTKFSSDDWISLSPDGKMLCLMAYEDHFLPTGLLLYNIQTGKLLRTIKTSTGDVHEIKFSLDGQQIEARKGRSTRLGYVYTLHRWNAQTGKFLGYEVENTVFISPDGRTRAVASKKLLSLNDVKTGKVLRTLPSGDVVTALAFSPDSRLIAIGYGNGTVKLWRP